MYVSFRGKNKKSELEWWETSSTNEMQAKIEVSFIKQKIDTCKQISILFLKTL